MNWKSDVLDYAVVGASAIGPKDVIMLPIRRGHLQTIELLGWVKLAGWDVQYSSIELLMTSVRFIPAP